MLYVVSEECMSATLEVIRERIDLLQKQVSEALAEGKDVSSIKQELDQLLVEYSSALKLVTEGKQLLLG